MPPIITKKYIALVFIFLYANSVLLSQTDSIFLKYEASVGVEKIEKGIDLCNKLGNNPKIFLEFSQRLSDDVKEIAPNTILHAKVLRSLSDAYYENRIIDKSNEVMKEAISVATSLSKVDSSLVGEMYNDMGMNYESFTNDSESAEKYLTTALKYLQNSDAISTKADAKSNLASLYVKTGKYQKAVDLFLEVYEIDKKVGNKRKISSSLNNIGRVYIDWKKYDTGIEYYLNSIELLDTINDKPDLAIRYNNIGAAYMLKKEYGKAIVWIDKATKIDEQHNNIYRLPIRYYNLGTSYYSLKNFHKAKYYMEKSKNLYLKLNDFRGLAGVYLGLGKIYSAQKQYDKSLDNYLLSEKYTNKTKSLSQKMLINTSLYRFHENLKNYKQALHYLKRHILFKDSLFNKNTLRQIEELEVKYQTSKKELEIVKLEADNDLKKKEINFRKRERNIAIGGLIIIVIILIILFKLYRKLRSQKMLLASQNKELERLNKIQNQLFSVVSHDFRSIITSYLSSAKIMEHYLEKGNPEKLIPIANELTKNSRNLSSMLENLLQWALIRKKGLETEKNLLSVNDVVTNTMDSIQEQFDNKENKVIYSIEDEKVLCDEESLKIILRNLLLNCNKFTKNGEIKLETQSVNDKTLISISDTGIGMSEEKVKNIFNFGKEKPKQGTDGEKGTGLGLILVMEHLEINNGSIEVSSELGEGTTFKITLPNGEK